MSLLLSVSRSAYRCQFSKELSVVALLSPNYHIMLLQMEPPEVPTKCVQRVPEDLFWSSQIPYTWTANIPDSQKYSKTPFSHWLGKSYWQPFWAGVACDYRLSCHRKLRFCFMSWSFVFHDLAFVSYTCWLEWPQAFNTQQRMADWWLLAAPLKDGGKKNDICYLIRSKVTDLIEHWCYWCGSSVAAKVTGCFQKKEFNLSCQYKYVGEKIELGIFVHYYYVPGTKKSLLHLPSITIDQLP